MGNGSVGIGTTSPWRTLDVNGTVGFKGLTNDTADQKTLCLTSNNEVVSNSGSTCITSSQRFKNTILSLDDAAGLAEILKLNPVSFHYNDNVGIPGEQVGFIAEQVNTVDPRLVVFDASNTPYSVKYQNLTAILTKAVQELAHKLDALTQEVSSFAGQINALASTVAGFAEKFTTKELVATNITADRGTFNHLGSKELCVEKSDGTPVCVTGDQLSSLLSGSVLGASTQHQNEAAADAPAIGGSGAPASQPAPALTSTDAATSTTSSNSDPITSATSSTPKISPPADDNAPATTTDASSPSPAANDNPPPPVLQAPGTDATSSAQ
jgi:endosialidase-like protein